MDTPLRVKMLTEKSYEDDFLPSVAINTECAWLRYIGLLAYAMLPSIR
jgi:hypothetical protein